MNVINAATAASSIIQKQVNRQYFNIFCKFSCKTLSFIKIYISEYSAVYGLKIFIIHTTLSRRMNGHRGDMKKETPITSKLTCCPLATNCRNF